MGKSKDLATGETRFVNTAGDTMTGDLTISSTAGQLKLTDTDGTEQNTTIKQSGGNLFIQARDNTNDAGIIFAGNGGGNYSEHMRINASGQVTKPNQPSFLAYGPSSWITVSGGSTNAMTFSSTGYNVGSHYNASNYTFTAPVAGKYLFHLKTYVKLTTTDDDSNHAYTNIQKNSSNYYTAYNIFGYFNNGDADQNADVTSIMSLSANDTVRPVLQAASGDAQYYGGACTFYGYLIG